MATQESLVAQTLAHLARGPARLDGMRLLGVDGPSGAGKSTFAAHVARRADAVTGTDVAVLSVDELLDGWHGGIDAALQDLVRDVLLPLSEGRPGRYRRYDWHRGGFGEQVTVPRADLLVVEGVGAGATALDPFRTTLVWLDAPADLRRRRALARDGDSYAPYWEHWAHLEAEHFARELTPDRADLRRSSDDSPTTEDGPAPHL